MSVAAFLRQVAEILDEAGVPYMLTGSLASAYYAVPRATQDLDVVIAAEEVPGSSRQNALNTQRRLAGAPASCSWRSQRTNEYRLAPGRLYRRRGEGILVNRDCPPRRGKRPVFMRRLVGWQSLALLGKNKG